MSSPKTTECSFKIIQKLPQKTSENKDEQIHTLCVELRALPVEDGYGDGRLIDGVFQAALGHGTSRLHQKLRVILHRLD